MAQRQNFYKNNGFWVSNSLEFNRPEKERKRWTIACKYLSKKAKRRYFIPNVTFIRGKSKLKISQFINIKRTNWYKTQFKSKSPRSPIFKTTKYG